MKSWRQDLTGQRFDKLVVLSFDHNKRYKTHTSAFWRCKCDCGTEKVLRYDLLKYRPNRSCGCSPCSLHKQHTCGKKSLIWKGCGDISATYYRNLQSNAKTRNFDFGVDMTMEYLWELFERQNKKCALTGIALSFNTRDSTNDGTASLDRIDAKVGYIRGNVQWVHKDINRMKQHYPEAYFVEMCGKVTDYFRQKTGGLTISDACGILCPR